MTSPRYSPEVPPYILAEQVSWLLHAIHHSDIYSSVLLVTPPPRNRNSTIQFLPLSQLFSPFVFFCICCNHPLSTICISLHISWRLWQKGRETGTRSKRRNEIHLTIIRLSEHFWARERLIHPQEAEICYLTRLSDWHAVILLYHQDTDRKFSNFRHPELPFVLLFRLIFRSCLHNDLKWSTSVSTHKYLEEFSVPFFLVIRTYYILHKDQKTHTSSNTHKKIKNSDYPYFPIPTETTIGDNSGHTFSDVFTCICIHYIVFMYQLFIQIYFCEMDWHFILSHNTTLTFFSMLTNTWFQFAFWCCLIFHCMCNYNYSNQYWLLNM